MNWAQIVSTANKVQPLPLRSVQQFQDRFIQIARLTDKNKPWMNRRALDTKAVGCIFYCKSTNRILIVKQRANGYWSLPKGQREAHEGWADTAVRESVEETGLKPDLSKSKVRYICQAATEQTVYYLVETNSRGLRNKVYKRGEIQRIEWVNVDQICALRPLGYNRQLVEIATRLSKLRQQK